MLKAARKKAQDKALKDKMAADQANSQGQLQAAQGAEAAKEKTLETEMKLKMLLDDHLTANKIKILQVEAQLGLRQSVTDSALKKNEVAHEKSLELSEK